MKSVVIFGGTIDGRKLAEKLAENGILVYLCVATDSGNDVLGKYRDNIVVSIGRKTFEDIEDFIKKINPYKVIDATHPYALEITENIKKVVKKDNYLRLIREISEYNYGKLVGSIEEACALVCEGNVLATTGSKQISEYLSIENYKKRLYARVLPTEESVLLCKKIGLSDENIITNLGACSYEDNKKVIEKYDIKTMISKDGGKSGGFHEKMQACKDLNVKFLIIKRPSEEKGFIFEEIEKIIME